MTDELLYEFNADTLYREKQDKTNWPKGWPKQIGFIPENTDEKKEYVKQIKSNEMDKVFLCGFAGWPKSGIDREGRIGSMDNGLNNVTDKTIDSWITELLQNAQDVSATRILMEINDGEIIFSHNGKHFSELELRQLSWWCGTTKSANLRSIGKFGIGFKFWRTFATEVTIESFSEDYIYSITEFVTKEKPALLKIFTTEKQGELTTRFKFKLNEEWSNTTHFDLKNRVEGSLPFMLTHDSRSFELEINENGQLSGYSVERTERNEIERFGERIFFDIIQSKKDGSEEIDKQLKMSLQLSSLKYWGSKKYDLIFNGFLDELKNSSAIKEKNWTDEEIKQILIEQCSETYVSFCTTNNGKGAVASKFIASNSILNLPIYIDAPFNLIPSRLGLNMEKSEVNQDNRTWNNTIIELCENLLPQFLNYFIDVGLSDIGKDLKFKDELLNHKLICQDTSGKPIIDPQEMNQEKWKINRSHIKKWCEENKDSTDDVIRELVNKARGRTVTGYSSYNQRDKERWEELLLLFDEIENPPIGRYNYSKILKDNFLVPQKMKYGCDYKLMKLWRHLYQNHHDDLRWFIESLNPSLAIIDVHGDKILIDEKMGLDSLPDDMIPICQSYGEGVPKSITDFINDQDEKDREKYASLIDIVVTETNENDDLYFLTEVVNDKSLVVDEFDEEYENIVDRINKLNKLISKPIKMFHTEKPDLELFELYINSSKRMTKNPHCKSKSYIIGWYAQHLFEQSSHETWNNTDNDNALKICKSLFDVSKKGRWIFTRDSKDNSRFYLLKLPLNGKMVGVLIGKNGKCSLSAIGLKKVDDEEIFDLKKPQDQLIEIDPPQVFQWGGKQNKAPTWVIPKNSITIENPFEQTGEQHGERTTKLPSGWEWQPISNSKLEQNWKFSEVDIEQKYIKYIQMMIIDCISFVKTEQDELDIQRGIFGGNVYKYEFGKWDKVKPYGSKPNLGPIPNVKISFPKDEGNISDSYLMERAINYDYNTKYNKESGDLITFNNDLKSHSIIRFMSPTEFFLESNINNEKNTQNKIISTVLGKNIPLTVNNKMIDVYWAKEDSNDIICSWVRLRPQLKEFRGAIGIGSNANSVKQRYSLSDCFNSLRNPGNLLLTFMKRKPMKNDKNIDLLNLLEIFSTNSLSTKKCLFPFRQRSYPHIEGLNLIWIDSDKDDDYMLKLSKSDLIEDDYSKGLDLLVSNICEQDSKDLEDSLDILEQVSKYDPKWSNKNSSSNNQKYFTLLKQYLEKDITLDKYPKLYNNISKSKTDNSWSSITSEIINAQESELNSDLFTKRVKHTCPPVLVKDEKLIKSNENKTLEDILKSNEKLYILERKFDYDISSLFDIDNESVIIDPFAHSKMKSHQGLLNNLKKICENIKSEIKLKFITEKELVNHKFSNSETEGSLPKQLSWLEKGLTEIGNTYHLKIKVIGREESNNSIFNSNKCPSISKSGNLVEIAFTEDEDESMSHNYNELKEIWRLTKICVLSNIENVDEMLNETDILGPWTKNEDSFISEFCPFLAKTFEKFISGWDLLNNFAAVKNKINQVKQAYYSDNTAVLLSLIHI